MIDEGAAALTSSEVREEWCPHCKAYTLLTTDFLLLAEDGVRQVGGIAVCEVCTWSPYTGARRG